MPQDLQTLEQSLKENLRRRGAFAPPEATVGEYAKSIGGGLAAGVVQGASDIVLGAGRALQGVGAGMVSALTGADLGGPLPEGDPITAASEAVGQFTRNTFPTPEAIDRAGGAARFFSRTLPEFVGGAVPYLAGGELAGAVGMSARMAELGAPAFMGALGAGHAGFQDAIRNGADAETAWASYLTNAGVGAAAMGLGPLPKILARADRNSAGMLARALEGAAVGAGQTFASDLIARELYDDSDRNTAQRMLETGAAGGLSAVLLHAVSMAYAKSAGPAPEAPVAAEPRAGVPADQQVAPPPPGTTQGEAAPAPAPITPEAPPVQQGVPDVPQTGMRPEPQTPRVPPPWNQEYVNWTTASGSIKQPPTVSEMATSEPRLVMDAARRAGVRLGAELENAGIANDEIHGVLNSLARHMDDSPESQQGRATLNEYMKRLPPDVELRAWLPQGPDGPSVRDLFAADMLHRAFELEGKERARLLTAVFGDPGAGGWRSNEPEALTHAAAIVDRKLAMMPEPQSVREAKTRAARARPAVGYEKTGQQRGLEQIAGELQDINVRLRELKTLSKGGSDEAFAADREQLELMKKQQALALEMVGMQAGVVGKMGTPAKPAPKEVATSNAPTKAELTPPPPLAKPVSAPPPEPEPARQGQLVGNPSAIPTTIRLASGATLKAAYSIVELDSIQPSHDPLKGYVENPLGDKNERSYGHPTEGAELRQRVRDRASALDPRSLINDTPTAADGPPIVKGDGSVLGGNGRTMSLILVHNEGNQATYRAALDQWAKAHGIEIGDMQKPVLVRVVDPSDAGKRGELSRVLNEDPQASKTMVEDAISRGAKITEDAAQQIAALVPEGGSVRDAMKDAGAQKAILAILVKSDVFSQNDVRQFSDADGLTATGKDLVELSLLGAAIPDIYALRAAPDVIQQAIMKSLGGIVRSRIVWPRLGEIMTRAIEGLTDSQQSRMSVKESISQATIVPVAWKESREGSALAQAIDEARGEGGKIAPLKVKALFNDLAQALQEYKLKQGTMFGPPHSSPEAAFWSVMEDRGVRGAIVKPPVGDASPRQGQVPDFFGAVGDEPATAADLDPMTLGAQTPADPVLGGPSAEHASMEAESRLNSLGQPPPANVPIDKWMSGTLRLLGPDWDGVAVPSRQVIVKELARLLQTMGLTGAQFRQGRMGVGGPDAKLVRGQFYIRSAIIRLARRGDIGPATHEFGHALEKMLFGVKMDGGNVFGSDAQKHLPQSSAAIAELRKLGELMYPGAEKHVVLREGWAEYWRRWFTEPESIAKKAPGVTAWVEGPDVFGKWPELAAGAEDVRTLIDQYRKGGSLARVDAQIARPYTMGEKKQRTLEKIKSFSLAETFLDLNWALKEAQQRAATYFGSKGAKLPENLKIHEIADRVSQTAGPKVRSWIDGEVRDLLGNVLGPGLRESLKPAEAGGQRLFEMFVYARRAVSWLTDPLGGRDPGISIQDARAALADIRKILKPDEHAGFETAADNFERWFENVNAHCSQLSETYAADWERIQKLDNQRQRMDASWQPNYAPLRRDNAEVLGVLKGYAARGYSVESTPLRKAHGSGARVVSPIFQAAFEAEARVNGAHRMAVADAARRLEAAVPDVGDLIVKVPERSVVTSQPTIDTLIGKIEDALSDHLGVQKPDIKAMLEADGIDAKQLEDALGERIAMFGKAPPGPNGLPTLGLWNAETRQVDYYEVSPAMSKALEGLSPYRLKGSLAFVEHALLQVPKQIFTMGTTGLRATFSLLTNPQRDVQTLYMNTVSGKKAHELAWIWAKTQKNALRGALKGKEVDWFIDFYKSHGLLSETPLASDTNHVDVALSKAFGRDRFYHTVKGKWDLFKDFLQIPEMVTRVTEMKAIADSAGWSPDSGVPLSEELANRMILGAKQVSTNFTAGGEWARAINRAVPFFNAAIQGPYASWRAAGRSPGAFMLRGLSIAAASAALWLVVKDQDWYKELAPREKYSYWHVPWSAGDKSGVWRIPMAHEIGSIFGALPMAMLDALHQQDPQAALDWAGATVGQAMPNMLPPLFAEALEQASNRDFFSGMPIVPRGQEDVPAEEQFGDYTTRASIALGRLFGWSPRRIDHMIRGTAGTAALDLMALSGRGTEDRPYISEPSDIPILGSSFQRGGQAGTQPRTVTDLYDLYGNYYSKSRSTRHEETREDRQRRLRLQDATQAISALTWVRSHTADSGKRAEITRETVSIAKEALEIVRGADVYNPGNLDWKAKQAKRTKLLLQKYPEQVREGGGQ